MPKPALPGTRCCFCWLAQVRGHWLTACFLLKNYLGLSSDWLRGQWVRCSFKLLSRFTQVYKLTWCTNFKFPCTVSKVFTLEIFIKIADKRYRKASPRNAYENNNQNPCTYYFAPRRARGNPR